MKAFMKGPILAWRLGLGPVVGRTIMIVTTTGRKSGLPRHTVVGFHETNGHKYLFTLRGPNTDWYRNMLADPHVTIQTTHGAEPAVARRVTEDREVGEAYEWLAHIPVMRRWAVALGAQLSRETLIAHKDDFILMTFEPTTEPTPPSLRADLMWVWPALLLILGLVLVVLVAARQCLEAPR
jgi:deazaflavin-dependent oxidoreductase (nitroreductase family)